MDQREINVYMFYLRMTNLFDNTCAEMKKLLREQRLLGEKISGHIDGLIAFAMELTLQTYLKSELRQEVIDRFLLWVLNAGANDADYRAQLSETSGQNGASDKFYEPTLEFLMAGQVLLEQCGKTDDQGMNDTIRQIGAEMFTMVCAITKREVESARLDS
jgi:hypothetical protein